MTTGRTAHVAMSIALAALVLSGCGRMEPKSPSRAGKWNTPSHAAAASERDRDSDGIPDKADLMSPSPAPVSMHNELAAPAGGIVAAKAPPPPPPPPGRAATHLREMGDVARATVQEQPEKWALRAHPTDHAELDALVAGGQLEPRRHAALLDLVALVEELVGVLSSECARARIEEHVLDALTDRDEVAGQIRRVSALERVGRRRRRRGRGSRTPARLRAPRIRAGARTAEDEDHDARRHSETDSLVHDVLLGVSATTTEDASAALAVCHGRASSCVVMCQVSRTRR